jgi:predicted acyltransferase
MSVITMNRERLVSVDAFRGATVAAMILVNNPGDWSHIYAPLEHAAWNGWTPTDLIFPFFLFLVGASLSFSTRDTTRAAAIRALKIFGLGFFMAFYPRFASPAFSLALPCATSPRSSSRNTSARAPWPPSPRVAVSSTGSC